MAKVTITIDDTPEGVMIQAEINKDQNLEGTGTTEAEEFGIYIMDMIAEGADEVYQEGDLIKTRNSGGIDGKH